MNYSRLGAVVALASAIAAAMAFMTGVLGSTAAIAAGVIGIVFGIGVARNAFSPARTAN